jgi:hypothetical protein
MDREAFFNRKARTSTVTLDDGQTVHIRKLSQGEVETIGKKFKDESRQIEGLRFIVARCVIDEDGKRIFADDDANKMTDIPFDDIHSIAHEAMRFSGMKADAKNA